MKTAPSKIAAEAPQRIAAITLDERTVIRRNPEIERERAAAKAHGAGRPFANSAARDAWDRVLRSVAEAA